MFVSVGGVMEMDVRLNVLLGMLLFLVLRPLVLFGSV